MGNHSRESECDGRAQPGRNVSAQPLQRRNAVSHQRSVSGYRTCELRARVRRATCEFSRDAGVREACGRSERGHGRLSEVLQLRSRRERCVFVEGCRVARASRACGTASDSRRSDSAKSARAADVHGPTDRSSRMLKRYLSALRRRAPAIGETRRARAWAQRTFDDFVVTNGSRKVFLLTVADHALRLRAMIRNSERVAFARALLSACASIDSMHVRLASARLRSYEDISIQVASLQRF